MTQPSITFDTIVALELPLWEHFALLGGYLVALVVVFVWAYAIGSISGREKAFCRRISDERKSPKLKSPETVS